MRPDRLCDLLMNAWRDGDLAKANFFAGKINELVIAQRQDSFAMYLIYGIALQALSEYEKVLERLNDRDVKKSLDRQDEIG